MKKACYCMFIFVLCISLAAATFATTADQPIPKGLTDSMGDILRTAQSLTDWHKALPKGATPDDVTVDRVFKQTAILSDPLIEDTALTIANTLAPEYVWLVTTTAKGQPFLEFMVIEKDGSFAYGGGGAPAGGTMNAYNACIKDGNIPSNVIYTTAYEKYLIAQTPSGQQIAYITTSLVPVTSPISLDRLRYDLQIRTAWVKVQNFGNGSSIRVPSVDEILKTGFVVPTEFVQPIDYTAPNVIGTKAETRQDNFDYTMIWIPAAVIALAAGGFGIWQVYKKKK